MNPDTGEIRRFMTQEEADEAGFTVPIPEHERARVEKMNRHQRRRWARDRRRKGSK